MPRRRLLRLLLCAAAIFGVLYVLYSAIATLRTLDAVEAERDTWQKPAEMLRALDLHEGYVVVDLGSGAGYFALKLSPMVGSRGRVVAVDLRRLSLSFLWIRALTRNPRNIDIHLGDVDDPRLPPDSADAVLIANTYHEFRNPEGILGHVYRSLHVGGRLVVVDRVPHKEHGRFINDVERELGETQFEVVGRTEEFLVHGKDDIWWMLIARKR